MKLHLIFAALIMCACRGETSPPPTFHWLDGTLFDPGYLVPIIEIRPHALLVNGEKVLHFDAPFSIPTHRFVYAQTPRRRLVPVLPPLLNALNRVKFRIMERYSKEHLPKEGTNADTSEAGEEEMRRFYGNAIYIVHDETPFELFQAAVFSARVEGFTGIYDATPSTLKKGAYRLMMLRHTRLVLEFTKYYAYDQADWSTPHPYVGLKSDHKKRQRQRPTHCHSSGTRGLEAFFQRTTHFGGTTVHSWRYEGGRLMSSSGSTSGATHKIPKSNLKCIRVTQKTISLPETRARGQGSATSIRYKRDWRARLGEPLHAWHTDLMEGRSLHSVLTGRTRNLRNEFPMLVVFIDGEVPYSTVRQVYETARVKPGHPLAACMVYQPTTCTKIACPTNHPSVSDEACMYLMVEMSLGKSSLPRFHRWW